MALEHYKGTRIKRIRKIKVNGVFQTSLANLDIWFQGIRDDGSSVTFSCPVATDSYSFYFTDLLDENVHKWVKGKMFYRFNAGHTVQGVPDGDIRQSEQFRIDVVS